MDQARDSPPSNALGTGNRERGPGSQGSPQPTQLVSWAHLASWGQGITRNGARTRG